MLEPDPSVLWKAFPLETQAEVTPTPQPEPTYDFKITVPTATPAPTPTPNEGGLAPGLWVPIAMAAGLACGIAAVRLLRQPKIDLTHFDRPKGATPVARHQPQTTHRPDIPKQEEPPAAVEQHIAAQDPPAIHMRVNVGMTFATTDRNVLAAAMSPILASVLASGAQDITFDTQ